MCHLFVILSTNCKRNKKLFTLNSTQILEDWEIYRLEFDKNETLHFSRVSKFWLVILIKSSFSKNPFPPRSLFCILSITIAITISVFITITVSTEAFSLNSIKNDSWIFQAFVL